MALPEDLDLIPISHVAAHSVTPVIGILCPLLVHIASRDADGAQTHEDRHTFKKITQSVSLFVYRSNFKIFSFSPKQYHRKSVFHTMC